MRSENYRNYFKSSFMMGPNCLRLLDEILGEYPLHYTPDNLVLDLGCGTGVTSLFIANETGFTSAGYFCRKFRQYYNRSPKEYRKKKTEESS
jgi:cyclopropane fatty-acyl-phospholipid synthase-like methyltransferase